MPADDAQRFVVRMTAVEKRQLKALAASQGLTLGQATLQAFQAWELLLQSRAPARGSSAGADLKKPGQPKRAVTPRQDLRRAGEELPLAPDGDAIFSFSTSSRAWLQRAARLDWSKCPAAELVRGKTGKAWVVRGTDAPLAKVFLAVADGQPFLEITEVFEITLQQLLAVLQFAAAPRPG